jgi:hypothetical protein
MSNLECAINSFTHPRWGRVGLVDRATRYRLDGPGRDYPHRPDRLWGPPRLLHNGYPIFPGGKAAGAWCWPPTPSIAEVEGRVLLYLYSRYGPSCPVLGWILPLSLPAPDVATKLIKNTIILLVEYKFRGRSLRLPLYKIFHSYVIQCMYSV